MGIYYWGVFHGLLWEFIIGNLKGLLTTIIPLFLAAKLRDPRGYQGGWHYRGAFNSHDDG